ncbi:helix-turn-helix transcriptional regulator [Escherichia coli]
MQSPLRNVRKAHGFTLQHVAAGVQVNPATLSRIERLMVLKFVVMLMVVTA